MEDGFVCWITGLSGAGKTTFANALQKSLHSKGRKAIIVDGDVIRDIFGKTENYSEKARLELAYKYSKLASFLSSQGINVICATISLFHEVQEWNRQNIKNYFEIFIDRDMAQLVKEDSKNIYAKALDGKLKHVVGVDIQPQFPKNPDLVIKSNKLEDMPKFIEKAVEIL